MKVEINIEKKHVYAIVFTIIVCSLALAVFSQPVPSPGHPLSEIQVDTNMDMGGYKIINLQSPEEPQDAANKEYVDNEIDCPCGDCGETKNECDGEDSWINLCTRSGWVKVEKLGGCSP